MLAPYRVLDLTDERGQLTGLMLAQLGAEVIAVEPPGGSRSRSLGHGSRCGSATSWSSCWSGRVARSDSGAVALYESLARFQWWRARRGVAADSLEGLELRKRLTPPRGGDGPADGAAGLDAWLQAAAGGCAGARVLDLGCGFGHHTRLLAELGCEAVGLDVSHAAISSAQSRSREWVERAGNTTLPQFLQADLLDSAAVGAAVGRRTFDVLLDAATFHCFDDEERGNYLQTLERLSHVGSHLLFLNFSDATEGTGGSLPRRLTKDEVLTAFARPVVGACCLLSLRATCMALLRPTVASRPLATMWLQMRG